MRSSSTGKMPRSSSDRFAKAAADAAHACGTVIIWTLISSLHRVGLAVSCVPVG